VGQIQTDGLDVVKEGALLEVDAEDLGQLSTMITTPMPALNPISTGSEMKLATNPRRRIAATIRMAPPSA